MRSRSARARFVASLLVLATFGPAPAFAASRTFVDSAGRSIAVPEKIDRVFAAGHPAGIILYTLAPETMLGWTRRQPEEAKPYIPRQYLDLPELGRLTGRGDTANIEVVLKAKPDVIFDYGSIRPTYISLADRVQAQTGVPYALIDGSLTAIPEAYRTLGRLLGRQDRAEHLARYAEDALQRARGVMASRPPSARPRVYYGRGLNGLETGGASSINVEMLDLVGAVNVAAEAVQRGLATVSVEQVLMWNPEIILTTEPQFYEDVTRNPQWRGIAAVEKARIYLAPNWPYGWFDRPPSVNRLLGLPWLLALLYPDSGIDIRATAREFYQLFYHHRLTETEINSLLTTAGWRAH